MGEEDENARGSLVGALVDVFIPAGTSVANAATVRVTGTSVERFPGTCGEPTWTGMV